MSETPGGKRLRASDEERDYVLQLLQQAHAAGRLDVDELGQRQDAALVAKYSDEFVDLLDDLPEGREVVEVLRPAASPRKWGGRGAAQTPAPQGAQTESLSILSGKEIKVVPGVTRFHTMAFMGGDTIDFSDAMGPGVVMIVESQNVMGGSTLKVPPGVNVVDESQNILGGHSVKKKARGDGSNGTLVLRGFNLMGGNEIKLARP